MRHVIRPIAILLFAILLIPTLQTKAQTSDPTTTEATSAPLPANETKALIEVLRNEKSRKVLIDELEKFSSEKTTEDNAESTPPTITEEFKQEKTVSFGRKLAIFTKDSSEAFVASLSTLTARLSSTGDTLVTLGSGETTNLLWQAIKQLALIILVTYVVFYVLRVISLPFHRYMGTQSQAGGAIQTIVSVTASLIADVAIVLAAWTLGYLIAIYLLGTDGQIGIRQTLYLNAFLIVELVRVLLRLVLSPSTSKLRWIDISDSAAKYLVRRLTLLVSIIGYGHLLILPIVNQNVSGNAGTAVGLLVALLALGVSLLLVLNNRKQVANWLTNSRADETNEEFEKQSSFLHNLAAHWYFPAVLYLGALFVIVITRPEGLLFPVLGATGKILLAILAGMVVVAAISRSLSSGVQVPKGINERLPLLESRLNRFVPTILMAIKALVFFLVALLITDAIGLFDLSGWLTSQVGAQATANIISALFILVVAFLIWLAMSSWIDYRLNPETGSIASTREITLLSLFRNAGTIAILIITLMFALSELGIDIAPLIASAGVLGLAIGFGAQKLVQDIITGIFIQFENAINVGDVITLNGTTGSVERLTIRSVSLRDYQGAYHIIPFSSVDMVTNYMREFAYFVCDMGVAYRENTDEVREAMLDAYKELASDESIKGNILSEMEWMGVQSFGDNAVVCRARLKTKAGSQWATGRAYNVIVKKIFDERGIEMPFPHRTIYFGEDKDGNAPAAPIALEQVKGEK